MRDHELDQMLSREKDIMPSTRFTKSVMDAVRAEASAPPPLTFSWLRVLPLLATAVFTVAWIILQPARPVNGVSWMERLSALLAQVEAWGIGWVLLALLLTAACIELTWRLSDRRT